MDDIRDKVQQRVERHLARSPLFATLNALLFTLFTATFGFFSALTHPGGAIDGVIYWTIFFWSILVAIHSIIAFQQSGAWHRRRTRLIQDEVTDAGDTYQLTTDEMIELHLQTEEDIRKDASPFHMVLLNGVGNFALWPGGLVAMLIVQRFSNQFGSGFTPLDFRTGLMVMLIGTLALGFLLPLRELLLLLPGSELQRHQHDKTATLRALYGYKRKRHLSESEERLSDAAAEGDLIEPDDLVDLKRKVP